MEQKKNIWVWIVVGVIVLAVIVYLALTGGFKAPAEKSTEGTQTEQGAVAVPGASPVTEEGTVLNTQGEEAKNDVQPGSPEAPQQSNPIAADEVPTSATKVTVSAQGFSPAEFSVKAGAAVTLSVTSADTQTHIFLFDDPSLSAVAVGIGPGETRAITFNAPTTKGEYAFHCDVPGHAGRGEAGKMVVN